MFDEILHWRLLAGSHKFPGPDGGTCINEAAIIAAGFKYRQVHDATDCPKCFSRPIAGFAVALNDMMPDRWRNELLLPFVTRLAGTADTREIESARETYVIVETTKRIMPMYWLAKANYEAARRCAAVVDEIDVAWTLLSCNDDSVAVSCLLEANDPTRGERDGRPRTGTRMDMVGGAIVAVSDFVTFSSSFGFARVASRKIFVVATEILDGAIKLGKHGGLDVAMARQRLEQAKEMADAS